MITFTDENLNKWYSNLDYVNTHDNKQNNKCHDKNRQFLWLPKFDLFKAEEFTRLSWKLESLYGNN